MQIQPIYSNINRPIFKGQFEQSKELNKLIQTATEKDLMEFSLMLDIINNSNDKNYFYIKEKKQTSLNPEKGFILWWQKHWDSFPEPCKTVMLKNIESNEELTPVLGKFINILKSIYHVDFDKDVKSHFQKQIVTKLTK